MTQVAAALSEEQREEVGKAIGEMREYIKHDAAAKQSAERRRKAVTAGVIAMLAAAIGFLLFFLLATTWQELFPPTNGGVGAGSAAVKPISDFTAYDKWSIVAMIAAWFACGVVAAVISVLRYNKKIKKSEVNIDEKE